MIYFAFQEQQNEDENDLTSEDQKPEPFVEKAFDRGKALKGDVKKAFWTEFVWSVYSTKNYVYVYVD